MQYLINSVGRQNVSCYTFTSPTTAYIQGIFINAVGSNIGSPIGFTATPTTKTIVEAYRTATSNATGILPYTYKTFHFSVTGTVNLGFNGLKSGNRSIPTIPSVNITNGTYKIGLDINPTNPLYNTVNSSGYTITHIASSGPLDNPLKGMWYAVNTEVLPSTSIIPYSVGFKYFSWAQVCSAQGSYNWNVIDSLTTGIRNPIYKDKRIVLRLWLNYPGQDKGVPQWVLDKGVTVYTMVPSGSSREWEYDYDNRDLIDNLKDFIAAYGAKYNNNPQIAAIQFGIFGQYGEGTTYRLRTYLPSVSGLIYSASTQAEIATAMLAAFPNKPLCARYSGFVNNDGTAISFASSSFISNIWIGGFHDDMLFSQIDSFMLKSLNVGGKLNNWKSSPMTGETGYNVGSLCIVATAYTDVIVHSASGNVITSAAQPITPYWGGYSSWKTIGGSGFTLQTFNSIVENRSDGWVRCNKNVGTPGSSGGIIVFKNSATGDEYSSLNQYALNQLRKLHLSYGGVYLHYSISSMAPWQIENLKNIVRSMGYQYRLISSTFTQYPPQLNNPTNYIINLINEGCAPFYEKWPVQLKVEHTTNSSYTKVYDIPTDIRKWLPGYFKIRVPITFQISGTYNIYIGIWDSWLGIPNIKFANANPTSGGWTLLQSLTI